jgi:hypothetical protein
LNRGAVDEVEFDHSHISGGISKINTADNVFGIFTSRAMRERGRYQIQCMKSRSSTGVGMKVDLDYNIETMRITDSGEDSGSNHQSTSSIMSQIKSSSRVAPAENIDSSTGEVTTMPVKADVNGSKLKGMLATIKANSV